MLLCPVRKKSDGSAEEPNEFELNSIRNDPDKLKGIRMQVLLATAVATKGFWRCRLPSTWTILVRDFGRMFCQVAGNPRVIDAARSRKTGRRFYVSQQARELLATL